MIKDIIKNEVENVIGKDYSHAKVPQIVLGLITKGGSDEVNLKILDQNKNIDNEYAEIPKVKVDSTYATGDKVVVLFLFGKLEMPYILFKYTL